MFLFLYFCWIHLSKSDSPQPLLLTSINDLFVFFMCIFFLSIQSRICENLFNNYYYIVYFCKTSYHLQYLFHYCCHLRVKSSQLDKLKSQLILELDVAEKESKLLTDYKAEMEALLHEKMAHVEELRLIHADINLVSIDEGSIEHVLFKYIRSENLRLHKNKKGKKVTI